MTVVKKNYIFCLICALMLCLFLLLCHRAVSSVDVDADNVSGRSVKIIIDAGHGAEDGGAVSASGLLEKDINLDIALTLEKLFLSGGFEVEMIRRTDAAIYDSGCDTLRSKKISDIHNRSEICNSDENNIYISIHQNKFDEIKYKGTQVFYSVNDPGSIRLAESIRYSVVSLLQNDNERELKPATSSIYILDKAQVPAVLVECGFLSNPREEKLLSTDEYKNNMAYSIYLGFLEYYNQNY